MDDFCLANPLLLNECDSSFNREGEQFCVCVNGVYVGCIF